jgi:tetratricopeptide (TPR) repeat protein
MTDLESALAQVDESLSKLHEKLAVHCDTIDQGKTLAADGAISDVDLEALYQQAYDLFQAKQYQQALPLALQVSAFKPTEWRYLFIAGMSFQFLDDYEAAASFYGFTLMVDPACTPAAYRLAECLSACGDQERAKQIYEAVVAMGRDVPEHHRLQDLAQKHLSVMH